MEGPGSIASLLELQGREADTPQVVLTHTPTHGHRPSESFSK